ncbi:MAG: MarR family winged helix-turn-helix transcriptional regulator [Dietzia sp.]
MSDPTDPTVLAADLREALRPLWRRFNAHRTLSMGKSGILFRLEHHGALTATDLAALERISHQAVAGAVRELEEMGLVSRSPDPGDGRRVLVTLTDAGRSRLVSERSAGQEWLIHAVTDGLSESERATLAAAVPLLNRLDAEGPR